MAEKCSKRMWRDHSRIQCSRAGVVERDGRWWCRQHDPEAVQARLANNMAKFRAEQDERREQERRRMVEQNACRGVATDVLEGVSVAELLRKELLRAVGGVMEG